MWKRLRSFSTRGRQASASRITREQALAIHHASLERFGGEDLYHSAVEKACRLAFGVIRNHPFADGNKRTGTALLGTCLRMASFGFRPGHQELLAAMLAVADGSMDYDALAVWVRSVVS